MRFTDFFALDRGFSLLGRKELICTHAASEYSVWNINDGRCPGESACKACARMDALADPASSVKPQQQQEHQECSVIPALCTDGCAAVPSGKAAQQPLEAAAATICSGSSSDSGSGSDTHPLQTHTSDTALGRARPLRLVLKDQTTTCT